MAWLADARCAYAKKPKNQKPRPSILATCIMLPRGVSTRKPGAYFLTQATHQPFGLIFPVTTEQLAGGLKSLQPLHF
jgi:hypothetical protein